MGILGPWAVLIIKCPSGAGRISTNWENFYCSGREFPQTQREGHGEAKQLGNVSDKASRILAFNQILIYWLRTQLWILKLHTTEASVSRLSSSDSKRNQRLRSTTWSFSLFLDDPKQLNAFTPFFAHAGRLVQASGLKFRMRGTVAWKEDGERGSGTDCVGSLPQESRRISWLPYVFEKNMNSYVQSFIIVWYIYIHDKSLLIMQLEPFRAVLSNMVATSHMGLLNLR